MSPRRKKQLLIALLLLTYVLVGFFRESVFVHLNEQRRVIYNLVYRHLLPDSPVPQPQWIWRFDYFQLTRAKWILTLLFTIIFALMAAATVRVAFNNKSFVRLTLLIYAGVFLAGWLVYLLGSFSGLSEELYDVSRFLAGLVETPAMLAILCAAFLAMRLKR